MRTPFIQPLHVFHKKPHTVSHTVDITTSPFFLTSMSDAESNRWPCEFVHAALGESTDG